MTASPSLSRSLYAVPVLGWIARDIARNPDSIWYALVILLTLSSLGVQWTNLAWIVSALSVGIGFGLQEIVKNFVSGLILLTERPVKVGDLISISGVEGDIRRFFYLPFQHSEDLRDQERSLTLFQAIDRMADDRWAEHHQGIIARFGRFPHRNGVLGRASTPDELDYLKDAKRYGQ